MGIEEPGVYPVMVNVNGTPDYGEPARLDDARFLLPVLGVPRDPAADTARRADGGGAARHLQTGRPDHAVAARRPAAAGRRAHPAAPHRSG